MYSSPEVPGQLSRYPPLTAVAKVAKCRHSTVVNAREDLAADARRKPRETAKTERRMDKRAMKRLRRLPTFADLRPCPLSGIRQMLCLLECSIVGRSPGTCH